MIPFIFSAAGVGFIILLYPNSAPPLTGRMLPVINLAFPDTRNTQASATTSPSGQYPNAWMPSRYFSMSAASCCAFPHSRNMRVQTPAGALPPPPLLKINKIQSQDILYSVEVSFCSRIQRHVYPPL